MDIFYAVGGLTLFCSFSGVLYLFPFFGLSARLVRLCPGKDNLEACAPIQLSLEPTLPLLLVFFYSLVQNISNGVKTTCKLDCVTLKFRSCIPHQGSQFTLSMSTALQTLDQDKGWEWDRTRDIWDYTGCGFGSVANWGRRTKSRALTKNLAQDWSCSCLLQNWHGIVQILDTTSAYIALLCLNSVWNWKVVSVVIAKSQSCGEHEQPTSRYLRTEIPKNC